MVKSLKLNIVKNKSNGQYNISLPIRKLKESNIDLKKMKSIKISMDGFE